MSEEHSETDEHRYLFTVRQRFNEVPVVDTFYELRVPAGLTGDQAKVMKKLKEDFIKEEIAEDTSALHGMQMRLRFNSDMFQHVCLVRTASPITAEDLDRIVEMKHSTKELMAFLKESTIDA